MQDANTDHWIFTVDGHQDIMGRKDLFGRKELGTMQGTRAEAAEELWRLTLEFRPGRPWRVTQRWFYQDGEGYIGCYQGVSGEEHLYGFRFGRLVQPPRG